MTNDEYMDNAVRRLNAALASTARELGAFTNEKISWSISPLRPSNCVQLRLQIGERSPMHSDYDTVYISARTAEEANSLIRTLYWEYIDTFPDLLQHKFAASLYSYVAQLCGARCDVVQQFSIRKEDVDSTTYIVTLRNYKAGLIQQSFSGLLAQNDAATDIVHRSVARMIRTLEDWPNVE